MVPVRCQDLGAKQPKIEFHRLTASQQDPRVLGRHRKHKGECWRLTGACLVCGYNKHKVKDCLRARSFTAPRTKGTVSVVQKSNKDNKSIASPSVPRQATQTIGRQDARAPARAYAMKAVEDKDAPDVIVGNFHIFETIASTELKKSTEFPPPPHPPRACL